MRFKTFLEARLKPYGHEPKDLHELVELIHKNCSKSLKSLRIYRGSKSVLHSGVFNPADGKRTSANTSNYYTKILGSNPANKHWPNREESFIATSDYGTANSYGRGTVLALFPYDSTMLGVVNAPDFWETRLEFKNFNFSHTVDMNVKWKLIFQELGREVTTNNIPNLEELIDYLNKVDPIKLCEALKYTDLMNQKTSPSEYEEYAANFIKELPLVYSYKSLGCELVSPAKFDVHDTEVWFSGKCIGVTMEDLAKIENEL